MNAKSPYDCVYLLADDAGTATVLEYREGESPLLFNMHTDGSNYRSLIIPDGGYRNPVTPQYFEYYECKDGMKRNRLNANLEGEDILSFDMHTVPKCINGLLEHFELPKDKVEYFLIHQANQLINMRLKIDDEHCPYDIHDFGNTSSTSIPLMFENKLHDDIGGDKNVACGLGIGLGLENYVFENCYR